METGTRDSTAYRCVAGLALALALLGLAWPGRLPGADIAVYVLLVAVGALMARSLLVERSLPILQVAGDGLRLLMPPMLVLVAVAIVVQRWFGVADWQDALTDVRAAAASVLNLSPPAPGSPVAHLWVVTVITQSALVVFCMRRVFDRFHVRAASVVVLLLVGASFDAWLHNSGHALRGFGAVGLGVLIELVVARVSVPRRAGALLAWATVAGVAGLSLLDVPDRVVPVVGVTAGCVLVACGAAERSPLRRLGDQATVAAAGVAWAGYCWGGAALVVAPEVLRRDLGLRDRVVLLLVVVVLAVVTVLVLELGRLVLPTHWAWWPVLVVATAVTAILVTVPGLHRTAVIEEDAAQVERTVTADLPDCFGAAEIAAGAEGDTCHNPDLDGITTPAPGLIGTDFESFLPCWSQPFDDEVNVCELGTRPQGVPRVLVVGDSHARVLFGAFQRLADSGAVQVDATAKASCAWSTTPITDRDPRRVTSCAAWRAGLATWLDAHATDYDVIVTTAYDGRMVGPRADQVQGLVDAWEPVARRGVPIVALRDNPRLESDPADCLVMRDPQDWGTCDVARDEVVSEFDAFEPAAKRVVGATFVDTWRFYCDDETCPVVIGGVGVYRDYNHLSATYGESLAPFLYREIARTGVFTR